MNTAKIEAAGRRLLTWARRRAAERSTYAGVALVLGALGKTEWAAHVTALANGLSDLGLVTGGALIAASTTARASATDAQP